MRIIKILILVLICGLSIVSCKENRAVKSYAFYHWKTDAAVTPAMSNRIANAASGKLYVRMFDLKVDKSNNAVLPIATIQIPKGFQEIVDSIIPVIYIKNEVFQHTDSNLENMDLLVDNIASKLKRLVYSGLNQHTITQVQIDCDWTDSTRERYFLFLKKLKSNAEFQSINQKVNAPQIAVSCTIRWHQVKYRERTGVPPVDHGVIMAYNVGNLANVDEHNSIINNEITTRYVERLKNYPLSYDIALPVFEWFVHYRNSRVTGIHSDIDMQTINAHTIPGLVTNNHLEVSKDFLWKGISFYKGDILRQESVSFEDLEELAQLIKQSTNQEYETIFYHINSTLLDTYTHDQLSQVSL